MTDDELLYKVHKQNKKLFYEMAECIGAPSVYDALITLRKARMSALAISEKFEIPHLSVWTVLKRIAPFTREQVGAEIAKTRSERHGLRLTNGMTLWAHCQALGYATQSREYSRERARLARNKELVTAEEYRRAVAAHRQKDTLSFSTFSKPKYGR
jgi:hypothetical protein